MIKSSWSDDDDEESNNNITNNTTSIITPIITPIRKLSFDSVECPKSGRLETYPHMKTFEIKEEITKEQKYIYNIAKFKAYNDKSSNKKNALADYFKLWIQTVLDTNPNSNCKYISLTLPFTYKQLPVGACKIQWDSWVKDSNILYKELFSKFSRLPRGIMLSVSYTGDMKKVKPTSEWHFSNNSLNSVGIKNKLDYLNWDGSNSGNETTESINNYSSGGNGSISNTFQSSIQLPSLDDYTSKKRLFNIKDYKDYEIILFKLEPELDMNYNYTPLKQYLQLFIRYKLASGIQSLKNIEYELPFTYKELTDYKLGYMVKWNDWQDNSSIIIYELFKPIISNYPIDLNCSRTISLIQKPENMKWYFLSSI